MKKIHDFFSFYFRESVIIFTLFITCAYYFQGGFSNVNTRLDLALSLLLENTFSIDTFHRNTIDKVLIDSHFYSEKAPGVSYLIYLVLFPLSFFISSEIVLENIEMANFILYLSTVVVSGGSTTIAALFFYKILKLLKLSEKNASIITLFTFLGSMLLPYSTTLFSHQISANLIIISFYYYLKSRKNFRMIPLFFLIVSFIPFFEFTLTPVSMILLISFFIRENLKDYVKYIPIILVPLICILAHNYFSYGSVLSIGYDKLQGSPFETGMSRGFVGLSFPKVDVLIFLLFSFYKGFFIFNPICIYPIFNINGVLKGDKYLTYPLFIIILILFLINSSYFYWQGGNCFGPRHLVPLIPVWMILFSKSYSKNNGILLFLFLLSFSINFVGTSVDVFLPERILNPIIFVFEKFINGSISLNKNDFVTNFYDGNYTFQGVSVGSGAWNLGERMGLSGLWSIFSLFTVHLISFLILLRFKGKKS